MKKALFWDFDGTLVHSPSLWSASVLRAIRTLRPESGIELEDIRARMHEAYPWDMPHIDYSELTGQKWWGHMFRRFSAVYTALGIDEKAAEEASRLVRIYILDPEQYLLYDDTVETLAACLRKGYENYVLSNNYPELPDIIRQLGIARYFAGYIVSGSYGYDKPRPELFEVALRAAGYPDICYMIGDNPSADIAGGRAAGMRTILVHRHMERRAEADYAFEDLADIPGILE